jgi:hypothetical protein
VFLLLLPQGDKDGNEMKLTAGDDKIDKRARTRSRRKRAEGFTYHSNTTTGRSPEEEKGVFRVCSCIVRSL